MSKSLDNIVCDLKWSKRLKEIGIRQDTFFHYVWDSKNESFEVCWSYDDEGYDEENYAAFTVQEFIEIFPRTFKTGRISDKWEFYCEYADMEIFDEKNMANVFARILITIAKNKKKSLK